MVIGLPILKSYVDSEFYKMNKPHGTMIKKNFKMSCKQEKYESRFLHWLA